MQKLVVTEHHDIVSLENFDSIEIQEDLIYKDMEDPPYNLEMHKIVKVYQGEYTTLYESHYFTEITQVRDMIVEFIIHPDTDILNFLTLYPPLKPTEGERKGVQNTIDKRQAAEKECQDSVEPRDNCPF